jgi:putative transposase
MHYRRSLVAGGTWFFTVNLADRRHDYLIRHIDVLRQAVRLTRSRHPFEIIAMVVLPDHLHAIWTLPPGDANYPLRWALIKSVFPRSLPQTEFIRESHLAKRERGIWQRRYWAHQIRDEADWQAHVDYSHFNPVKHGYVQRVSEWPFSSFHRYVHQGLLPPDWAGAAVMRGLDE